MQASGSIFIILVCGVALSGCHHSGQLQRSDTFAQATSTEPAYVTVTRFPVDTLQPWNPKYIQTGASSGIMVEFTGLKKDRPLNAHYALIQVWRDSLLGDTSRPQTLLSQINEFHQAFFPLAPGTYLMRQMKEWADRSIFQNVVVKEDHYAIVPLDVAGPWKQRSKDAPR
jgi:hypothetical protein